MHIELETKDRSQIKQNILFGYLITIIKEGRFMQTTNQWLEVDDESWKSQANDNVENEF